MLLAAQKPLSTYVSVNNHFGMISIYKKWIGCRVLVAGDEYFYLEERVDSKKTIDMTHSKAVSVKNVSTPTRLVHGCLLCWKQVHAPSKRRDRFDKKITSL